MGISTRWLIAATLFAVSGCVLPGKFMNVESAPAIQPASVVATWNPKVAYTPDPANGGVASPGLIGRVYLFGPTADFPLTGDGAMTVELFDDTPHNGQPSSVQLETWRFDATTMKRLQKRDAIGAGYTVFLPWGTHRPDVRQVHMTLKYEPASGTPIYAPSGPMTLEQGTPNAAGH